MKMARNNLSHPNKLKMLLRGGELKRFIIDSCFIEDLTEVNRESDKIVITEIRDDGNWDGPIETYLLDVDLVIRALGQGYFKHIRENCKLPLLPSTKTVKGEKSWSLEISVGNLINALFGVKKFEIRWIECVGVNVIDEIQLRALTKALAEKNSIHISLDEKLAHQYCDDYCNTIMWSLSHYPGLPQEDRLATARNLQSQFDAYKKGNHLFSDVIKEHYEEEDVIWYHDYHLMYLHKYMKDHNPKMKVGWFLCTPFPPSKKHRMLQSRGEFTPVFYADLVGFYMYDYAWYFVRSCTRILGLERTPEGVEDQGKIARVVADHTLNVRVLCVLYVITDGMKLGSYEFVACQVTEKGVLILSEMIWQEWIISLNERTVCIINFGKVPLFGTTSMQISGSFVASLEMPIF